MASVKITTKGYYTECGEPGCCSDYWTDWTLYIDGEQVGKGTTVDPYESEIAAALTALKRLGHTVTISNQEEDEN